MKKVLFATSALVAAGAAGSVYAAEWETGVSGYYHLGLGLSDLISEGVGVLRDGEAHLDGRLVADNGLTFQARVEIEAHTTGDQIDENWGLVRGSFGQLMIGGNDTAVYENQVGVIYAPGARIGYADSFALTNAAIAGGNATPGLGNDALGIHYQTPEFYGLYAYGTYIPNLDADGAGDTNAPVFNSKQEALSAGLTYQGDFGDFGVGGSFGYTDIEGVKDEMWTFAGNVSYQGFKVAGFYEDDFNDDEWGVGGQYGTGPWTIAGGYSDTDKTDTEVAAGWITYQAAPGVSLTAGMEYADTRGGDNFGALGYMRLAF